MGTRSSALARQPSAIANCLQQLSAGGGSPRPLAVYRMQFHAGFRFQDARRLLPYLHALGITHLYSSPILKARPGSTHGYDIVDHNAINPEIGTEADFRELVADLKSAGMGLVLDIVPNHMGVGYGYNSWWQDVLENGRSSAFADFFDIDWEPLKPELRDKVLLPVLGGPYGEELEQGHIQLRWDGVAFWITYYEKNFAVDPRSWPAIFEGADVQDLDRRLANQAGCLEGSFLTGRPASLSELLRLLRNLPPHNELDPELVERRRREAPALKQCFAQLAADDFVRSAIDRALARMNGTPGEPASFDALHRLLEAQAYRLAHWRVSAEEVNYRRFFDINDLVGMRMENPRVFAATHRLVRRLLADGSIEGIRLDHPDGLFNPAQYFTRLQMLYCAGRCHGPEPAGETAENGIELDVQQAFATLGTRARRPLYVVVEKILEPGEQLPEDWTVDGTVGYEFGALLTNLFIDSRNRRAFTNVYHRFIGGRIEPEAVIYESKKLILHHALASEVAVLAHELQSIGSADRHARDFTYKMLADAIREVIACFPVYRTYADARGHVSDRDRACITEAVARAKRRNESTAAAVFDYLRDILLLKKGNRSAELARRQLYFVMKFQQLTGPTMAKGLEDTACYIYNRLVSVNEVGGSPREFGVSVEDFHAANQRRAASWPTQLLNTSTHDSKRSEDVRARLNVLSEMPKTWSAQVMRWRRANRIKKRIISDGRAVPDSNEEYLLYQTLVGAWPLRISGPEEQQQFVRRIQQYMTKAVHEAKVNLSWTNPNPEYVQALEQFIARIFQPGRRRPNAFLQQIEAFLPTVQFFGALNSLAQVLLKIAAPGVPDIYQGQELFDFSLVDPDNRRPVDFQEREKALAALLQRGRQQDAEALNAGEDDRELCRQLLTEYRDGRVKLWTTLRALRFRREHPELFRHGSYLPLPASGSQREHAIAFAREYQSAFVLVAAPRLAFTLLKGDPAACFADAWGDTAVSLPPSAPQRLFNIFTGETLCAVEGSLLCRDIFRSFPLALLTAA